MNLDGLHSLLDSGDNCMFQFYSSENAPDISFIDEYLFKNDAHTGNIDTIEEPVHKQKTLLPKLSHTKISIPIVKQELTQPETSSDESYVASNTDTESSQDEDAQIDEKKNMKRKAVQKVTKKGKKAKISPAQHNKGQKNSHKASKKLNKTKKDIL